MSAFGSWVHGQGAIGDTECMEAANDTRRGPRRQVPAVLTTLRAALERQERVKLRSDDLLWPRCYCMVARLGQRASVKHLLAAYLVQDIEQDSARLLSSGLFKTARPLVFPPRGSAETYPQVRTAPCQALCGLGTSN